MVSDIKVLLLDNGSIKPEATLLLRQIARELAQQSSCPIDAVSLRHADKIKPRDLEGQPAKVLKSYLRSHLESGHKDFIVVPLFFGMSHAITEIIPQHKVLLENEFGHFNLIIADVLYPLPQGEPLLAGILVDHILQKAETSRAGLENVVLVDHGSPSPRVTAVRQHLATVLQQRFGAVAIEQAVMEKRDAAEFDFNGPLLQDWLTQKAIQGEKSAIVALMFLLPGRHAGEGGDIETICSRIKQRYPEFNVQVTGLVSDHAELINILQSRLQSGQPQ